VDKESRKPDAAAHRHKHLAKLEWIAAAVILKMRTFGKWMLRTFVPVPPANGGIAKVRSPANVRSSSS
jgi:hypothetical protein